MLQVSKRDTDALRSGSSAGPEAAARFLGVRACAGSQDERPGEDRHLMRVGVQYAAGSWCGVPFPTPAASRRVWGVGQSPTNPPHANSGDSISPVDLF